MADKHPAGWRHAIAFAALISLVVLGLFTYWFSFADRYRVFLYYHDMGPLVPDTSPFGPTTSSRYWMAGLVASGAILVLHTAATWLLGRLVPTFRPPDWWRVWVIAALIILVGIPAITMTTKLPALPLANTIQVTMVTLTGLATALLPGRLAAQQPAELAWLAADGWGVMLFMVPAVGIERIPGWLARGDLRWVWMTGAMLAAGLIWLLAVTLLGAGRRRSPTATGAILLGGAIVSYLVMPLVHHVAGTDGYYYISDSANFFAMTPWFQLWIWLAAMALADGIARLRKRLATRRSAFDPERAGGVAL